MGNFAFASENPLLFAVLVFVALMLMLDGLYLVWRGHKGPQAKRLQRRLQALAATADRTTQTRVLKQRLLAEAGALEKMLMSLPRLRRADRFILQSGLSWTVSGLLTACAMLFVLTLIAAMETTQLGLMFSLLAAAAVAALPFAYVGWQRRRRLDRVEKQLPEALDLLARALRAGHAFTAGLKMAGEELPEPVAGEFRTVHDEVNYGISLQQALTHLSERVPLTDLRYFVVAVLVQRESGGNLTEILTDLGRLIRERGKLMDRVKVLSTEGRMSAWILGLMPFGLAGLLSIFNPKFISLLWTDPIGISITKTILVLMAIGALVMRKIVRIRV